MRKWIIVFGLIIFKSIDAADMQTVVNQTIQEADQLKSQSYQAISHFDPNKTFASYSARPSQTQYYSGSTQTDKNKMNQEAVKNVSASETGNTVMNSINQHPKYTITQNAPDMKHSMLIQSEADNIVHGVTSQYTDCKPKQACHVQYTAQQCIESAFNQNMSCRKNRIVSARQPDNAVQTVTVNLQGVPVGWFKHALITTVDLVNNKATETVGKITSLNISPHFIEVPCEELQIILLKAGSSDPKFPVKVDILEAPSCQNHFKVKMRLMSGGWFKLRAFNVIISYRIAAKLPPIVQESWSNDCYYLETLANQGLCQLKKSGVCLSKDNTRQINGISILRDCWSLQSIYDCHAGKVSNTCGSLQTQGCEQIGSICQNKINNVCISYQQTYRCPIQTCSNTTDVVCGDGKNYCLDDSCVDHSYKPSQDFEKGISALSAMAEASHSFDSNANFIFRGHAERCRDDAANFSDCCRQTGWGQDWNLAHCSDEEKSLGPNREKGLTVYVGRYCSDYLPWPLDNVCIEHKETYCVFGSKLARIIQQQGRGNQLHKGFGEAENPNCEGMTPEELQHINLSTIDFHEFYADLNSRVKTPDLNQVKQMIQQHINQYSQSGQSNE